MQVNFYILWTLLLDLTLFWEWTARKS